MTDNENLIPIPGRLHSVATEGHVAGADEIYDDNKGKLQSIINSEVGTELGNKIPISQKGVAKGVASLDNSGKVPPSQLPSYVDDVVNGYFYNGNFYKEAAHTTVITNEEDKIYVDIPTSKSYRWSGSAYILISNPYSVDEEDLTTVNNNIKFKDRPNIDGMGKDILRKNIISGVNTLTQSMINQANTIYVIQYDFTLGENITIPENCILEFDGGSLSGGTLIGNHTSINDNGCVRIFGDNLIVSGKFNIKVIWANWFAATEDYQMFQRAFDTAYNIKEAWKGYYKDIHITVTCIPQTYIIRGSMDIRVGVSFDGNGCCLTPTTDIENVYMFYINAKRNKYDWIEGFPGNYVDEFCNIRYENPDNIITHFVRIGDSRHVHNIQLFRPAKILTYLPNYIDGKKVEQIYVLGNNTNYPLDTTNYSTFEDSCNISFGLGDNCFLRDINDGVSVFISSGASAVVIQGAINLSLCVVASRTVTVRDVHGENGIFSLYESSLSVEDSYFFSMVHFIMNVQNNKYSELFLSNVQFGNLPDNFSSYYPIKGQGKLVLNNVFGLINKGKDGHNSGESIMLYRKNNRLINPIKYVENNGIVIYDDLYINKSAIGTVYLGDFAGTQGSDIFMRRFILLDQQRNIRLSSTVTNEIGLDASVSSQRIRYFNYDDNPQKLTGCILRYEFGTESGVYTKYFDKGLVYKKLEFDGINISNNNDVSDPYIITILGLTTSNINYSSDYCDAVTYERRGTNVKCRLDSNTLPNVNLFTDYDEIILSNGNHYVKYNNTWNNE